ncbi:transmembrane protein 216-like isoform X2 [Mustelus asterias]
MARAKPPPVLSLSSMEVLLFLNTWYYAAYFVAEILLFIYKTSPKINNIELDVSTSLNSLLLPYTPANLILDLVMLFLYLGVEVIRIFFGSKGNLSQRKVPFSISLVLLGPSTIMAVYYMLLQTYVLRLEVIINAILLVFYVFELLLYIVGLISFSSVIIND